jgi:hypothetical protein
MLIIILLHITFIIEFNHLLLLYLGTFEKTGVIG